MAPSLGINPIGEGAIAFTIPGEAVPFARSGGNGRMRYTPARQRDFMATVKQIASDVMAGSPPLSGPIELQARFVYLTPASWSRRKKFGTRWKTSKPDVDNLVKIIKDALNKIVWADDAQVADLRVQKVYGPVAQVTVTVQVAP